MSLPRLLVDENLSVALPPVAHARGFECAHVAHAGFHGWKDWSLMEEVARSDWVLVTNNAVEFRGRYREIELHPGVVFIVPNVRRAGQIELFDAAPSDIEAQPDLMNTALDVDYGNGTYRRKMAKGERVNGLLAQVEGPLPYKALTA